MLRTLFIISTILIIFSSCVNQTNPILSEVVENDHTFRTIQYEEINDSLNLKLTDLAVDWRVIHLETKEECLIERADYYIYDNYIIANIPFDRILLFDGEGNFIRKITQHGKGPQEVSYSMVTVDEENDRIFVADDVKNYILSWDLQTGSYLGDIQRPYQGKVNRILYSDQNTLLVAPVVGYFESGDYYVWEQSLDGQVLQEVKAPHYDSYQDMGTGLLFRQENKYNYLPVRSDTIFQVGDKQLNPAWYLNLGKNNEALEDQVGYRSFNYLYESDRYFSGIVSTITWIKITDLGNGGFSSRYNAKREILILDKKKKSASLNQDLINDVLGFEIKISQLTALQNQQLLITEDAINFIEKAEIALSDDNLDSKIKSKLKALLDQITPEDNPVILVGKIK